MSAFARHLPLRNVSRQSRAASSPASTNRCDNRSRGTSQNQQMNSIEVERKFRVSEKTLENLNKLSTVTAITQLDDSYFCEELALKDHWLRRRNGSWELKMPVLDGHFRRSRTTVYRELVGASIWQELNVSAFDVDQLVPYAKILTERKKLQYQWNGSKVQIVLDTCTADNDFRYDVGEIEILVNDDSEVEHANFILDQVATSLGLRFEQYAEGKLMTYLREKHEPFYQKLAEKGLT